MSQLKLIGNLLVVCEFSILLSNALGSPCGSSARS